MKDNECYQAITSLPNQCFQAYSEATKVNIPRDYRDVNSIVVCGMGGSALGPEIIGDVFRTELAKPYIVNRDYEFPYRVDEHTLVILSSYSGTTEEVLACGNKAIEQGAKMLAITTGAKLGEFAEEKGIPLYRIDPRHNPSGQPRMGLGYGVFGILALLSKMQLVSYSESQLSRLIDFLHQHEAALEECAQAIVPELKDKIPILIGAQHLKGAVHALNNFLNETADTFTAYFYLPELDHHLLEGFSFPVRAKQLLRLLLIKSPLYSERIQKRLLLTEEIARKQGFQAIEYQAAADDKLIQALEVVMLGEFISLYLAKAYGIDPAPVPRVEEFKRRLRG
ncbi:hypothetical protein KJ596_00130 [Patescibacteria group bacterium]|nr:hypothetical protein [Patescibacteria group bacterium]MBU1867858.1 hypothetical protein [Patescibacteria group bacterium]